MLLTGFWFVTGVAYVAIGVFNYSKAKSLTTMDFPPFEKYRVPPPEEPDPTFPPLHAEKGRTPETTWEEFYFHMENYAGILRDLNNAFDSVENIASEFNKSVEMSRGVLRVAAFSFFIAAGISFVQGIGSI
jgi:hypothetical protein